MKTIKGFLITILFLAVFSACEKDGALITLSGLESSDLMATQSEVVLTQATSTQNILSVSWTTSTLTVSDPSMSAPNVLKTTLQVSKTEDFSGTVTESVESSLSHAYTGSELNTIAKNLGAEPGTATSIYFRLKASIGDNMDPVYSNVVSVKVTAYQIDMRYGYILDSNQEAAGDSLYSVNSDGEYVGFMGATSWYNFYLKEGDGTTWGNDGVSGTPFVLSSEDDADKRWNCWFPGIGGCYYVDFNTNDKEWSALLISSLSVSGDVSGDMTFDRPNNTWSISFTTTTANATFSVAGVSALYNKQTGTDDAAAVAGTATFAPDGSNNVLFNQTGTFTVPGDAGDYTLKINLSDPTNWTYEITAGSVVIENPISNYLYLPGVDDGISGAWTFDNYLLLTSEEDSTFAGVANVNSQWGYQMGLEADNWTDVYEMASGDAYSGTLSYQTGENIPAPAPGLYLIQADLKNLTYSLTAIDKVYYTGLNDDWSLSEMTETSTPGTYTAEITISKASEWGFQIFVDDQWTNKFGGSNGSLIYNGENITDDQTLSPGTYTLIVNLVKGTYSIASDQLYVVGLNDVWDFTSTVLPKTEPGIYSGTVTINADTPYGYYFLLYADNWDIKFGGSENALIYGGDNIISDWYATMGTYTMTVDLINRTCKVE